MYIMYACKMWAYMYFGELVDDTVYIACTVDKHLHVRVHM